MLVSIGTFKLCDGTRTGGVGVSTLQYQGSYTVVGAEAGDSSLGVVLNLIGGRPEWESMNALLQEIEDDLDNGRTTLRFGAAGHLTLQDMMEQLHANRSRTISSHIKERQTGVPGDPPLVESPTDAPASGSATMPTLGQPPWFDYINDQNAGDGNNPPATWDVLFGYGQSSFAGSGAIDHAGPIEKLELSAGNDGSGWSGTAHDASSLYNLFSMVSGDDNPVNDWVWIGRTNSSGDGGSIRLNPFNLLFQLSPNLDPGDDTSDDQFIHIDLNNENIQIQDTESNQAFMDVGNMVVGLADSDGGWIQLNFGGSPELDIYNGDTGNNTTLDENSLTMEDVTSGAA
jgi:hypothetical protein